MLATAPTELRPEVRRYQRHRPERTELHRIVRDNLDALCDPDDGRSAPPRFVLDAFARYLDCGLLCRGFLRARCPDCPTSVLIPFSCKGRGLCPSCGARRMEDTTEHIMTRVLPDVPVRQWVLSLPFQLRFLVGFDAELFAAIIRIFVSEVSRHHARRARELGVVTEVHSGVIACPQRFGSTLNLHPHVHLVAIDGVHAVTDEGPPVFHALPAPSLAEVEAVSAATCRRVVRLLERRGLATDEGLIPKDEHDLTAQQQLAEAAARQPCLFARVDADGRVERVRPTPRPARAGEVRGFSVHAGVAAGMSDVERRRRIVRYCVRPPFAAAQFRLTEDGRVAFQLRHPRSDGATHVVFSQLAVMHKLSSLVPAPGRHTVRYFGVLSSASPLRAAVVPAPALALGASSVMQAPSGAESPSRRATWAVLLRRVYGLDALGCPGCGGRLRVIAAITERSATRAILRHLDLDDEPPPPTPRPRGPPWLFDA